MIWMIIKADMLWMAVTVPLYTLVQVLVIVYRRRQQKRAGCAICEWRRQRGLSRGRFRHWR